MTTETTDTDTDAVGPGRGGRMSRPRKREAMLRLLRGEDLEMVSRALGVTAATLSGWRDAFLAAGVSGRPYGLALVCRVWRLTRSTVYRHREPPRAAPPRRPGPAGP